MMEYFENDGLYRPAEVIKPIGPLPISRSAMWLAVKKARVKPVKLGLRSTAFRGRDLNKLVADLNKESDGDNAESST